jgi:hypothetical protein
MSTNQDNVDQPDGPNEQFDRELLRELLLEWLDSSSGLTVRDAFGELERILKRGGFVTPPPMDEEGNPLPRLDVDNPPAEPPEDPLLRVGYALLAHLPEHWENVFFQCSGAADDVRTHAMVHVPGERPSPRSTHFFTDLTEPCLALRQSTYEPGRGAWYNAFIMLVRDGTIKAAHYDFDLPPFGAWGPREVALVLRDHELYPRDPEQLPDWHPAR